MAEGCFKLFAFLMKVQMQYLKYRYHYFKG
jgi:hypothetical protein